MGQRLVIMRLKNIPSSNTIATRNTITMPIDPASGKIREATFEEKVAIIEKRVEGKTFRQMGNETGGSRS
jgi:hypothetical protein